MSLKLGTRGSPLALAQARTVAASSELAGAKGGYGYSTRVPLSEIPPGLYVLNVEARSRLGKDAADKRQVQFRVVSPVRGPQQ